MPSPRPARRRCRCSRARQCSSPPRRGSGSARTSASPIWLAARSTNERSMLPSGRDGVPTQIRVRSASRIAAARSVVASILLALRRSSSPGSWIGASPRSTMATLSGSMSTHVTSCPMAASPAALTSPTYPVPITATFIASAPGSRVVGSHPASLPAAPQRVPSPLRGDGEKALLRSVGFAAVCRLPSSVFRPVHASSPLRFAPYQSRVRRKPSSRPTLGSKPRSVRALVMSGLRRLGLSIRYSFSGLSPRTTSP